MTITLFITILTGCSVVTALITEAIKKAYANAGKNYSSNIIALIDAIVVGCGGTSVCYMLMGIEWTVNNVICMLLMGIVVWAGATLGFDKVKQTIEQIMKIEESKNEEKN